MPAQFHLNEKDDAFAPPQAVERKREVNRIHALFQSMYWCMCQTDARVKSSQRQKVRRQRARLVFIRLCPLLRETLPLVNNTLGSRSPNWPLAITSDDGFVWKLPDLGLNIIAVLCHWLWTWPSHSLLWIFYLVLKVTRLLGPFLRMTPAKRTRLRSYSTSSVLPLMCLFASN